LNKKSEYQKPILEVYGKLEKITEGGGASTETDSKDFYS